MCVFYTIVKLNADFVTCHAFDFMLEKNTSNIVYFLMQKFINVSIVALYTYYTKRLELKEVFPIKGFLLFRNTFYESKKQIHRAFRSKLFNDTVLS